MATEFTMDGLMAAMLASMRAQMDAIVEEEAQAAAERVRIRLAELAPRAAMQLFRAFDVSRLDDRIVISVKHDVAG